MNLCTVSGKIASPPLSISDGKAMKFLVKAHYPSRQEGATHGSSLVPCVLFDVTEAQRGLLAGDSYKNFKIELMGRIVRSSYENAEGQKVWDTQVIVSSKNLLLQKVK